MAMQDDDIARLVEALKQVQDQEVLSLVGLAQRLGVSVGHLSMIFSGQRRPGVRFLRAVSVAYPEIGRLVAKGLRRAKKPPE